MDSLIRIPRSGLGAAALTLTAIAGALVLIGSIGTWVKADAAGLSAGGLDKDGPILIGLVLVISVQTAVATTRGLKRPMWLLLSVAAAALSALTGFVDIGDVDSNSFGGIVETGWGLKLATYASLALLAGTVLELIAARGAVPAPTPEAQPPPA
jgi:hypothetical protein